MTLLYYVLLGFAPGLFWLWYFRRKDDLEPEPRLMLLRVFALGCLAAGLILATRPLYAAIIPDGPHWWSLTVDAFVVTAAFEEGAKLLALLLGAYFHRELDEPLDGIIYGIAAALGFASVENVLYVVAYDSPRIGVMRGFTAVLGHVACTGMMGYFVGRAKFALAGRRPRLFAFGLLAAVACHGAYDFFLFQRGPIQYVSLVLVLPLGLAILGLEIRWSRALSPQYHGSARRRQPGSDAHHPDVRDEGDAAGCRRVEDQHRDPDR